MNAVTDYVAKTHKSKLKFSSETKNSNNLCNDGFLKTSNYVMNITKVIDSFHLEAMLYIPITARRFSWYKILNKNNNNGCENEAMRDH